MKVNFITTSNTHNGYGMTRDNFLKFLPRHGIEFDESADVDLILNIPPGIQQSKGGLKVLYTMLEGDEVPNSWYPYLNQADHILVPSNFVSTTFAKAGFKTHVIPLGYDPEIFSQKEYPKYDKFTFLHYEAFQDRKGWEDLYDAWMLSGLAEREFECQLILKTIRSPRKILDTMEKKLLAELSNVEIICGKLPHDSFPALIGSSHVFVFPSRGEGFGLPPLEAMACGVPLIVSAGHSHLDFYDEDYMWGVSCEKKIPARYSDWEDQGNFVRCNVDDLARKLLYVYEHYEEAKEKAASAVEYISKYSYDKSSKKLADFLWELK